MNDDRSWEYPPELVEAMNQVVHDVTGHLTPEDFTGFQKLIPEIHKHFPYVSDKFNPTGDEAFGMSISGSVVAYVSYSTMRMYMRCLYYQWYESKGVEAGYFPDDALVRSMTQSCLTIISCMLTLSAIVGDFHLYDESTHENLDSRTSVMFDLLRKRIDELETQMEGLLR